MEDNAFNFWQDHSLKYLEMAFRSDRNEIVEKPDGHGKKKGDCGDTVEMFLIVAEDIVKHVSFQIEGCRNTNACANTVAFLAEGKQVDETWDITPDAVIEYLETLSKENYHCAELAVGAFYLALANYQEMKGNRSKKLFAK
jgi:nitrogen fixation NifU-like protein